MPQSSSVSTSQFSPCASLAALGSYLQQIKLFEPIREQVAIAQKTIIHTPLDKLYDAWIAILAGAHGLVEVNTRLRSDVALQQAFGRSSCAEQSTIQDTLNNCTAETVRQLEQALATIYRLHSQGYRHNYQRRWQILDVDMSGMPCGKKAELATKGYFPQRRNRRGRQLGRVLASRYGEVVTDQLFTGTVQLTAALRPLLERAEAVLDLDLSKRMRTIVRVDAGGGSVEDINWVLSQGYQLHTKDYSSRRARKLAASVTEWFADPTLPGREVGWVSSAPSEYVRPLHRVAVRWQEKSGNWRYAVIISTLSSNTVIAESGQQAAKVLDHQAVTLAYVWFYDQRGGGVETALKDDKQGLGLTKRGKKRFEAQQMVMLLSLLAHNVIVWARAWVAPHESKLRRYGLKRMVRDIFHISGQIVRNARGRVVRIILNEAAPLVRGLSRSLDVLLRPSRIAVNWGQT